jgi:hypothetical protein
MSEKLPHQDGVTTFLNCFQTAKQMAEQTASMWERKYVNTTAQM